MTITMACLCIWLLDFVVTLVDFILLPVNYLVYKRPWEVEIKKKHEVDAKNRFLYNASLTEVILKSPDPPMTCKNREELIAHMSPKIDTMAKVFEHASRKFGSKECLGTRKVLGARQQLGEGGKLLSKLLHEDKYTWQSYDDVSIRVDSVARGLLHLGVRPHDKVLIYADTCAEWLITALACFRSAFTVVTLYTNLGEEGVIYGVKQVNAEIIVTNQDLLPKVLKLRDRLPSLKTVIVFHSSTSPETDDAVMKQEGLVVEYFSQVEAIGLANPSLTIPTAMPEDMAVIMYTSGSTGEPKGVMLTHENLVSALIASCAMACNLLGETRHPDETYLAYLPLAHIFELTHEIVVLSLGVRVGYSSPYTLTDNSTAIMPGHRGDAGVLKPTVMPAVPVILDRVYKAMKGKILAKGLLFNDLFDFCVMYRNKWLRKGYDTPLLNAIIFKKFRAALGSSLTTIIAGGAPLSSDVHDFLRATLGVHVAQGYGLTETVGGVSLANVDDLTTGRVGRPIPGVQLKIQDWEDGGYTVRDETGPSGEIIVGGVMVAKGYYEMPEKTAESFYQDEQGIRWFRTGDIGQLDPKDGALKIVDRKKDLVKLQMGEYVSLGKVEACLKVHPLVDNACVYADSFNTFTVALIVPDAARLNQVAMELNLCLPRNELCLHPDVVALVLQALTEHAKKQLEKFEIPKRLSLIDELWTPDTGLVTAALKLKRKPIQHKYQSLIDKMYSAAYEAKFQAKIKLP